LCNEIIFPVALAHSSDYHCWRAFSPELAPRTPGRAANDSGIGLRRRRGERLRISAGDGHARRVFEELPRRLQSDPGRAERDQRPLFFAQERLISVDCLSSAWANSAARPVAGLARVGIATRFAGLNQTAPPNSRPRRPRLVAAVSPHADSSSATPGAWADACKPTLRSLVDRPYTEGLRQNAQAASPATLVQDFRRGEAMTAEFCGDRLDIIIDPKAIAAMALWCG
jgi:hypothetical protein